MVNLRNLTLGLVLIFAATATTTFAAPFPVARSLEEANGAAGQVDLMGRGSVEMAAGGMEAMDLMMERGLGGEEEAKRGVEQVLVDRDIVNPPITEPKSNTIWTTGKRVTVKWDTKLVNSKPEYQKLAGTILLGHFDKGSPSENLEEKPLAKGFPLKDGQVTFTLPANTTPRKGNAIVILMGDSGNASQQFTIQHPKDGSHPHPHPHPHPTENETTEAGTTGEAQERAVLVEEQLA